MKKITSILCICLMALCMMFASCNRCSKPTPEPITGYNYDEVVQSDFQYIASQYPDFHFYEVDVEMDTTFNMEGDRYITYIKTIFQVNDTCIMIEHPKNGYTETPDTSYIHDQYLECMDMNAFNAVNWDSAMTIIASYRNELPTRFVTFRRVLAPPFPKNGQYIFGPGLLVVDAATGEVSSWVKSETDTIQLTDPVENTDTVIK